MNDFTSSNGVQIRLNKDGSRDGNLAFKKAGSNWMSMCGGPVVQALREFFQAEADERLGRWRVPGQPNWVCYATPRADEVVVFNEDEPSRETQLLSRGGDTWPYYRAAAAAYFDAHPEPKPVWHDVQVGEGWVLDTGMGDIVFSVVQVSHGGKPMLVFTRGTAFGRVEQLHVNDPDITAGRRIFPEVS